jgi:hypothetical protein
VSLRFLSITIALALIVSGCATDAVVESAPRVNDTQMYWALTLDYHAVTLSTVAPYDTIRLTATPRTFEGTALTDLPAPTYTSLDLDRATVDPDGLVHVLQPGLNIPVMASLATGNLRHADTAFFNVTSLSAPPVLATFSIHPIPPDSAKTAESKSIVALAGTADDTEITGLAVYYTSLDPSFATIGRSTGFLQPVQPGHVTLTATATAYGVTKTDTVRYTLGYPLTQLLTVIPQKNASGQTVNGFSPPLLQLGPGGSVLIINETTTPTDLTFDDPTNVAQNDLYCGFLPALCGSGNISAWARDTSDASGISAIRTRRFPVPGTYTYHSTIFGTTGKIIVVDDNALP